MAAIIIGRLDDSIKERLRVRAAKHGRSMEEEARVILKESLVESGCGPNQVESVRARVAALRGIEMPIPNHVLSQRD
jgi:plasmid stability protein